MLNEIVKQLNKLIPLHRKLVWSLRLPTSVGTHDVCFCYFRGRWTTSC